MRAGEADDTADLSQGRWAPRRLRAILRREGVAGLLGRAIERLGWRHAELYVCPLDVAAELKVEAPATADIAQLHAEDLPAFRAFRPELANAFAERLQAGHACFAARCDGRIVAATWVAVGPARAEHLRREFQPAPDEIYLFDSFTDAEHRGLRLYATIFSVIAATYRKRGYHRAASLIVPRNRSSVRSRMRSGFRRVGAVRSFPRGPIRTTDVLGKAHVPANQ